MHLTPDRTERTMPWKCLDCHTKWAGPADRRPTNGCPACGSRRIFDINVEFVGFVKVVSRRRKRIHLGKYLMTKLLR